MPSQARSWIRFYEYGVNGSGIQDEELHEPQAKVFEHGGLHVGRC